MFRFLAVLALLALLPLAAHAEETVPGTCHVGAYALTDGTKVLIQPSDPGNLRYRFLDGTTGRLFHAEGHDYESGEGWAVREPVTLRVTFGECGDGSIRMQWTNGALVRGEKLPLPTTSILFQNNGNTLYGELVMPLDRKPRAVVVLQYGGGRDSAVVNNYVQYLLPLHDIAVYVFDKVGTGRSTGTFNAHVGMLADDMAAAVDAVRQRPELDGVPLGLMGESQGGWVVPITASKRNVDFVIASYGMAESMVQEDRREVALSLRMNGYGDEALAKAEKLHRAVVRVLISRFEDGLEELASLKAKYRDEPWFKIVKGDFTRLLAHASAEDIPGIRAALDFPYDIAYDPLPVIASLDVPQLWILAGSDTEAPSAGSIERLRKLQAQGHPIDVEVFENAEHGMIVVIEGPGGRQLAGRTAPGYFDLLVNWILEKSAKASG